MKKFYLILSLIIFGGAAFAAPKTNLEASARYGGPFIFVEKGVEFAVYPDGQFDFTYGIHSRFNSRTFHGNSITYNSGYNYLPFVQLDDFGAVIQVKNVPVFYDYYGRIIRAGRIWIEYNHFGKVSRIGNMHIFYNPYQVVTHTAGFINGRNARYVPKPWHRYYQKPVSHQVIVFHQPYRAYYVPERYNYGYYKNHYNDYYQERYYRPGENISSYHKGRRETNIRDISRIRNEDRYETKQDNLRSNQNSGREVDRSDYQRQAREVSRPVARSAERSTVRQSSPVRRSENVKSAEETREVRRPVRTREPQARVPQRSPETTSGTTTGSRSTEVKSTRGSRSSRGRE